MEPSVAPRPLPSFLFMHTQLSFYSKAAKSEMVWVGAQGGSWVCGSGCRTPALPLPAASPRTDPPCTCAEQGKKGTTSPASANPVEAIAEVDLSQYKMYRPVLALGRQSGAWGMPGSSLWCRDFRACSILHPNLLPPPPPPSSPLPPMQGDGAGTRASAARAGQRPDWPRHGG